DLPAIGAVAHEATAVDRQWLRQAARERHYKRLVDPGVPGFAAAQKHDVGRIRRPGEHHVVRAPTHRSFGDDVGSECQPARGTTGRWHDIHVAVTLVLTGKSNPT